jgi:hypothetical protein
VKTNFILIDGIPGSGKSTLAQDIGLALELENKAVSVLLETDPAHPLHPIPTDEMGAGWPNIHEVISAEDFAEHSLSLWKSLLSGLAPGGALIVESFPFQSSIRVLMQMGGSPELISEYWQAWQSIVADVNPYIIYLETADARAQISSIAARRGPEWKEYIASALCQSPYCVQRGYFGWTGVEKMMCEYSALIDDLLSSSRVPVIFLEAEPSDYEERLRDALNSLGFLKHS